MHLQVVFPLVCMTTNATPIPLIPRTVRDMHVHLRCRFGRIGANAALEHRVVPVVLVFEVFVHVYLHLGRVPAQVAGVGLLDRVPLLVSVECRAAGAPVLAEIARIRLLSRMRPHMLVEARFTVGCIFTVEARIHAFLPHVLCLDVLRQNAFRAALVAAQVAGHHFVVTVDVHRFNVLVQVSAHFGRVTAHGASVGFLVRVPSPDVHRQQLLFYALEVALTASVTFAYVLLHDVPPQGGHVGTFERTRFTLEGVRFARMPLSHVLAQAKHGPALKLAQVALERYVHFVIRFLLRRSFLLLAIADVGRVVRSATFQVFNL